MEQDFYRKRLESGFGLRVIVPEDGDRAAIHRVIYDELCLGTVSDEARDLFSSVIGRLKRAGAEAVILGCTEITMAVDEASSYLPVYDTTALHAEAAVARALDDD